MVFSSAIFIFLFLPVVTALYFTVFRHHRLGQNILLFVCSLFFYAWGEPIVVLIMIASIIVNWLLAFLLDTQKQKSKARSKLFLVLAVIFNLGLLFIFKYLGFFTASVNSFFGAALPVVSIALPIGISFYTFQAMSYVIDVYRGHGEMQKNPLYVGLYISFFPQLIAGPIVRYQTIADQIKNRRESLDDFSKGVCRFIMGLAKKVLLANTMAYIADAAFSMNGGEISVAFAWVGAAAYTMQIFFDFSGYSDMAIGLGRMFGFHFLENFNYPYIANSISDFWRRWHISLGSWFRDYVYFPLGGSRVKLPRLILNLFIVWLLTGIWHGAAWTYIAWGLFYFIFIVIERLTGLEKKWTRFRWTRHIYTLFITLIGMTIFRSETLSGAFSYIKAMFGGFGNALVGSGIYYYFLPMLTFFIFAALFCLPLKNRTSALYDSLRCGAAKKVLGALYVVFLVFIFITSLSYIVTGSYNPFIYFNF